ncbi:MAG: hypothetical protein A2150_07045 [Candidatus Muproteobacteria bacterium RBG_16_64_11]|uniref:Phosphatidylethanolamine-binding protein n=1 Tax=Candidatus Muproteobacteria bacterium RBG_16_64_11 TaxID=1817758 RepID=A0A1F6TBX8_9PROT|nr:MAG: hypothetical protein A2150_07045 [Candidatus Muproteobacteria bacterium RBG_16_64_11]
MELASSAFVSGQAIPTRHTCDGEDRSPPLAWRGAPATTRGYAVLCDDPDAPGGSWSHWALYDLPASVHALPEGYSAAGTAKQGLNDFGRSGYGGPCPPRGHGPHHYRFRVLALDVEALGLPPGAKFQQVADQARRHVLAQAEVVGVYERRR